MDNIKIIDIISSTEAISPISAQKVLDILIQYIEKNKPVSLSFEGIEDCVTAFCNASIGKLYMTYPSGVLDNIISYSNIDPVWKIKMDRARKLGIDAKLRTAHQDSLTELLYA